MLAAAAFAAIGAGTAIAWDPAGSSWDSYSITAPTKVIGSNGNFAVIGANAALAWNPVGSYWDSCAIGWSTC
ncbi:MAG: hypothetical protein IT372_37935 [Polyangiaceae bacterium]|nr:hypothetical protein [Polyangiaceae bacterium]